MLTLASHHLLQSSLSPVITLTRHHLHTRVLSRVGWVFMLLLWSASGIEQTERKERVGRKGRERKRTRRLGEEREGGREEGERDEGPACGRESEGQGDRVREGDRVGERERKGGSDREGKGGRERKRGGEEGRERERTGTNDQEVNSTMLVAPYPRVSSTIPTCQ
eukprot:3081778-Rhodomonas_salina.1